MKSAKRTGKSNTPYGNFFDGQDGYWYGFANQGNSSGDATMYWIKIKKDDYSFTEGVWTLFNAHLQAVGSFKVDTFVERTNRGVIRNGYLYVPAYELTGIYKKRTSVCWNTVVPVGRRIEGDANCELFFQLLSH